MRVELSTGNVYNAPIIVGAALTLIGSHVSGVLAPSQSPSSFETGGGRQVSRSRSTQFVARLRGRGEQTPLLLPGRVDVVPQTKHGNMTRLAQRSVERCRR